MTPIQDHVIPKGSLILVTGANGFIGSHVANEALAAAVNALKAASKEPSVKSFVYTSSSTAAAMPKPNLEFSIDENTWNEETINAAWAPPPYAEERKWLVYAASKAQAEQEVWRW